MVGLVVILILLGAVNGFRDCKVVEGVNRDAKKEDDGSLSSMDLRDHPTGPDSLYFLDGLCFKANAAKHFQVTVCPFHNVTQRRLSGSKETLNGIWGSWYTVPFAGGSSSEIVATTEATVAVPSDATTGDPTLDAGGGETAATGLQVYGKMLYTGGDKCAGGLQRAATVELACIVPTEFGEALTGAQYFPPPTDSPHKDSDIYIECAPEGFSPASCGISCTLHLPFPCNALVAPSTMVSSIAIKTARTTEASSDISTGAAVKSTKPVGAGDVAPDDEVGGMSAGVRPGPNSAASDSTGSAEAVAKSLLRGGVSGVSGMSAEKEKDGKGGEVSTGDAVALQAMRLARIEDMLAQMKTKLDAL